MFDLKAEAAKLILNEVKNKIHEMKPQDLVNAITKIFAAEIQALKGDANHNNVVDLVEVEQDLAIAAAKLAHVASVLKAAHEAKK